MTVGCAREASVGELAELVRGIRPRDAGGRILVGIAGAPGSGKSTLAEALLASLTGLGVRAAYVPLDGYHLADVELRRQGLLERKGAPETFDSHGFARLLETLRARPAHPVFAPSFERELEQPIAGAIPIFPEADIVVTEGNYLLLDEPGWRAARAQLDEVWHLDADPAVRRERLVRRHIRFGKAPDAAAAWVDTVDEPNARLIESRRASADRVVRVRPVP
jgi:pantothenate kinase